MFCFPNADAGSHQIMQKVKLHCQKFKKAQVYTNLPAQTYWGLLMCADVMLGNSSSGIMETPTLKLPTINIGIRQKGREQAANIIDTIPNESAIIAAIEKALSTDFIESLKGLINPYGDGCAAEKIQQVLSQLDINQELIFKKNIL